MEEKDTEYKFFSYGTAKKFCDQLHQGFVDLVEPCLQFEPIEYNIAPSTVLYKMQGKNDISRIVGQLDPIFDRRYSTFTGNRDRITYLVEEIVEKFLIRETEQRPINTYQLAEVIHGLDSESKYKISFTGDMNFISVSIRSRNIFVNKKLLLDNININYFRCVYKCESAEDLYNYIENEASYLFPCLYYCFFPEEPIPHAINNFNARIRQCKNGGITINELRDEARYFTTFFNSYSEGGYKKIESRIKKTTYYMFLVDLASMILPNDLFVPVITSNKIGFTEKQTKSFI